jgi:hypothetical protein
MKPAYVFSHNSCVVGGRMAKGEGIVNAEFRMQSQQKEIEELSGKGCFDMLLLG